MGRFNSKADVKRMPEHELRFGVLITPQQREQIQTFLQQYKDVSSVEILQWDIGLEREEDQKPTFLFDKIPESIRESLLSIYPHLNDFRYASHSKLRVRCAENKNWSLEAKNNINPFDQELLKSQLKEKRKLLARLQGRLAKKPRKRWRVWIESCEQEIKSLEDQLEWLAIIKKFSDHVHEEVLRLKKKNIKDVFGKDATMLSILDALSQDGVVTGIVHKVRYYIERVQFFKKAIRHSSLRVKNASIDICDIPDHDGKFLLRLEIELPLSTDIRDAIMRVCPVLRQVNEALEPCGVSFGFFDQPKGQRVLAFEQYPDFPEDDPRKTPLSYFDSLKKREAEQEKTGKEEVLEPAE